MLGGDATDSPRCGSDANGRVGTVGILGRRITRRTAVDYARNARILTTSEQRWAATEQER